MSIPRLDNYPFHKEYNGVSTDLPILSLVSSTYRDQELVFDVFNIPLSKSKCLVILNTDDYMWFTNIGGF